MRDLTNPIQKELADRQVVQSGSYHLAINSAGNINLEKSFYQYTVMNLPGKEVASKKIMANDLPAVFKAKLKELHNMVVSHADSNGMLNPGTDVDDF